MFFTKIYIVLQSINWKVQVYLEIWLTLFKYSIHGSVSFFAINKILEFKVDALIILSLWQK